MTSVIDDREVALAAEHPRGTERKRLAPYRAALNDLSAYARLPEHERDAIVRWAEVRRRIALSHGIDNDPANLADPLLPAARLRAHVLEGERMASGRGAVEDGGGDLVAVVAGVRAGG
jgi:hypothetical protein